MQITSTFCGRRFRSMLFTASVSVCAEIVNLLIDKIVAAQILGEKALASISFFTPLFSAVFFVSAVVMVGSLVCYSFEIGKMDKERADCFFGQSIILSVGSGILIAALSTAFCQSMGIEGIALGTLVSFLLSIATLCTHFFKQENSLHFVWHFKLRDIKSVVRYSLAEAFICKDDGRIIDMTDLEQSVTDLRAYLITMFMQTQRNKLYLLTTNYNRHIFKFDR